WVAAIPAAARRAMMIAATSAASATPITAGSSVIRIDDAQFAAIRLRLSQASSANAAAPPPSQADSPAGLDSQMRYSGAPACSGPRAVPGSRTAAYPVAMTIPASSTPPIASDAINVPSRGVPCVPRYARANSGCWPFRRSRPGLGRPAASGRAAASGPAGASGGGGAPGAGRGLWGRLGGHGEKFGGGRLAESGVLEAGQHPGQLADAAVVVQLDYSAHGNRAVAGLGDHQVVVGEGRDLGQVGHHDHLGEPGQPRQAAA